MGMLQLIFIVLLAGVVILLVTWNYTIHKKIDTFSNLNERVTSLNVLQDFMNTLGESSTITEKLENINDILINKFAIKYSTIVVFNGAQFVIKASNVDQKHWPVLQNLQNDPMFKDSISTGNLKYVTVENINEKLPYQKMEFGRAKSAMFFPLYVDNVYIGYWIIEGSQPHEFDKVDTTILEVVKNNIVTILKTVEKQSTIENIVRDDLYSGLKSAEYLYGGEGKKAIDKYTTSAVCLFKITNLPIINNDVNRKTGDHVVTEVARYTKENLAKEYMFVRYMGPKFAIVFSGVDANGVFNFMNDLKAKIESMKIPFVEDEEVTDEQIIEAAENEENQEQEQNFVSPKIRAAISTYYKGTSIDGTLKKIEEFVDSSNENSISKL